MREFLAHVLELMQPWAPVSARAMFGGHGLYRDARMFALIVDDTLYLKADDTTRANFAAAGSRPFVYENRRAGKRIETSYWSAPPACLEVPAEMAAWCTLADEAALRKAAAPQKRTKAAAPPKRTNAEAPRKRAKAAANRRR